jgi:hypothetical protein
MQASILGNLIGRMGQPGSELATWNWLQQHSALGELIDVDFAAMSHMSLYRASDVLMNLFSCAPCQGAVFQRVRIPPGNFRSGR